MNKLKSITSISVADILGNGITAFFWFYLASIIEPKDYGEINYFIGIASMATVAVLFGTQNSLIVYVAKSIKIQSTLFLISLLLASIGFFIIAIAFLRLDAGLLLIAYVVNTLSIGYILGKKSYTQYAKYILIQKSLTLILGIGFYFIFSVEGIIYALAISYVVFSIHIYRGFRESRIDFELVKTRFGFLWNNYIMSLVGGFGSQIDKIIVAPILGYAFLGNYSLALQIISIMMIFSTIIFKYLLSQDASGKENTRLKIFTILISIGIAIVGTTISPFFISEFFPKYNESIEAIQIMSFGVIPGTISMIMGSKFLAVEKSKFVLISSLISLITITIGTITLGQLYETKGVAIAYVLSLSFSSIFLASMFKFTRDNNE